MDLRLGYGVFDHAVDQVGDAVSTIDTIRRRVAADVDALLGGGWTGAASESFGDAWEEWLAGAEQVRAALASLSASLELTRSELTATDSDAAADSRRLLERLV